MLYLKRISRVLYLKRISRVLLGLSAAVLVVATAVSDHSDAYGDVTLPEGGVVALPAGPVEVSMPSGGSDSDSGLAGALDLAVFPVGGGPWLTDDATTRARSGEPPSERSQELGEGGSVTKLDVPAGGDYVVRGSFGAQAAELSFGTTRIQAIAGLWRPLAGLLLAAIVISLIPVSRRSRAAGETVAAPVFRDFAQDFATSR